MSTWQLWVVAALYFYTALEYVHARDYWWALMWFGYTLANIALIMKTPK